MKIQLEKVLEYEQPQKYIVATENYSDEYTTPVLTAGKSFILGYTDETDGIYKGTESPVIIFDDFTSDTKYVDFDFKVKSSAMKILHKVNEEDFLKYFFYAMQKIQYKPFSHKRLWISEYSKFEIEKRTPEEQKIVVNDLDNINNAISLAKERLLSLDELVKSRFIEMFGDIVRNDLQWETDKLSILCPIKNYRGEIPAIDGKYWLLNLDLVESNTGTVLAKNYVNFNEIGNSTITFSEEYVLYSKLRPYLNKVVLPDGIGYATSELVPFLPSAKINKYYLAYALRSDNFVALINDKSGGAKMPRAPMDFVKAFPLPIPPISLQNEFAEFVKLIDKSKFVCQFIQGTFYAKYARFRPPP